MRLTTQQFLQRLASLALAMTILFSLLVAVTAYQGVLEFPDENLERVIREKLGNPAAPITKSGLLQITHLDASGRGIRSLEGMQNLRRLTVLDLRDNHITDLRPLATLERLTELDFRNNGITDLHAAHFDVLSDQPVRKLNLRHNVVRTDDQQFRLNDISLLGSLSQLEELDLRDNHIEDLAPLRRLHRLRKLDLRENRIRDLLPLDQLAELEAVDVRDNQIHDITPLQDLVKLRELNLRNNQIIDIRPLNRLTTLRSLNLRENQVADISVLNGLSNLQELNLRENRVRNLEPLAELRELIYVNIHSNTEIQCLQPLASLERLDKLNVRHVAVAPASMRVHRFEGPLRMMARCRCSYTDLPGWETLAPVQFSKPGGFYTDDVHLTLSHPDPDALIVYTLDGSEPDIHHLDGSSYFYKNQYPENPGDPFGPLLTRTTQSQRYSGILHLADRSEQPYELAGINTRQTRQPALPRANPIKATVVRASAFKPGTVPSPIATHTFFIRRDALTRYDLPVLFITTDEANLFDYQRGIYVAGKAFDDWSRANPARDTSWREISSNFRRRGQYWERSAVLELHSSNSQAVVAQPIGLRVHGGFSRNHSLKSLRVYAQDEAAGVGAFESRVFQDETGLEGATRGASWHRRLILRQSGNDRRRSLYRDAFMHTLIRHLPLATSAYQPAVHFINGEYWGLINIRERQDDHYLAAHYCIVPDQIAILTGAQSTVRRGCAEDRVDFLNTVAFAEHSDLSQAEHIDWIRDRIDTANLALYFAVQVYFNNQDWPGHNIDWWRKRASGYHLNSIPEHDGRWRWIVYDTDYGFGLGLGDHTTDSLRRVAIDNNPVWKDSGSTGGHVQRLFRALLHNNQEFRVKFINMLADQLNTSFQPDRVIALLDVFEARIAPYRQEHNDRWNLNTGPDPVMYEFAKHRPTYQRHHILNVFDLKRQIEITLDVSAREHGHIRINTVQIHEETPGVGADPYPWTGVYFSNVPIELEAIAYPGYEFTGWSFQGEQDEHDAQPLITRNLTQNTRIQANFRPLQRDQ